MKNKLNIFLLISFIFALSITIWLYSQTTNQIGNTEFNKNIDDSEFTMCNENRIHQYYSVGTNYQGGKREIKKGLSKLISNLNFKNSGFITYRFIINCNGKSGRFRVKTINSKLKENTFEEQKVKLIQKEIQNIKKWNAGKWKDENVDSYYILSFKIENGKITDIF